MDYWQCVPDHHPQKREAEAEANVEVSEPTGELEKRQTSNTPITGVKSVGAKCYNRLKLQTLQTNVDMFNMLLIALEDLQNAPETLDVSWFGIAGIHGAPYVPWQQSATGTYNQGFGYCVHGSPVFATWHRPYTLLMEQVLVGRAQVIAAKFNGTKAAAYQTAADQLRLPYWDWSDPVTKSDIPAIMTQATVSVTKPGTNGVPVTSTIKNPLFQYTFKNQATLKQWFGSPWANWMYTTRNPTSTTNPTARNTLANSAMTNGFTTRRSSTYQMFSQTSFNGMAAQLEGIHNAIHTALGGNNPLGHMSVTNVAAFDPIFWLHHVNVDRLAVMYQAIYPANQLQPANAVSTFARIVPGVDGPQDTMFTRLYPFKMSGGAWFTSNEIKSAGTIWKYKFGYPEVPCEYNGSVNGAQLSSNVRTAVNKLYGPTTTAATKRSMMRRDPGASALAYAEPKRYSHQPGYTPRNRYNIRNDYTLRITIDHSEVPGSWTCHIFLAPQPPNAYVTPPSSYRFDVNRIGTVSSFGLPYDRKQSMAYTNEVSLTDILVQKGLRVNKVKQMEKYLKDNLWVVMTSGDGDPVEIPLGNLRTYKVGVYVAEGKYPDQLKNSDEFPSWGPKRYLLDVMKGKPGAITLPAEMDYPVMLDGRVEDLDGDRETY